MQFTNPASLSGPVTVAGGHVDSVGIVQSVVDAVTTSGGVIDTVGEVQTVVNAVMAAGGTIDTVQEVQSVVDAVTAAGGHVDSVQTVLDAITAAGGHVDSVTSVTGSIPPLYTGSFFWPAISGESFPPSFTSAGYTSRTNLPCYQNTAANTGKVNFPPMPRTSVLGKTNLSFKWLWSSTNTPNGAQIFTYGAGGVGLSVNIQQSGSIPPMPTPGALWLSVNSGTTTVDIYDAVRNIGTDGAWHTIEVIISSAGAVTLKVDGRTVGTTSNILPPTTVLQNVTPVIGLPASFTGQAWASQLLVSWS